MVDFLNRRSSLKKQTRKPGWRLFRCCGLLLAAVLLLLGSWSWWTFVSPFSYSPPPSAEVEIEKGEHRVFAYGTLRNPLIRHLIVRAPTDAQPAKLPGYKKQGLDIIADSEEKVTGLVFSVTAQGLRRLDRYERLGIRYERIMRPLDDGKPAWIYRRLPE